MSERIPKGWKRVKLGDLINDGYCRILNNKREPLSKMQRYHMKEGVLYPYYGAAGIIDFINRYKFDGFYLLVAEDGTVTSNGINPMLQLVKGKFWVSNHAHVLQCQEEWQTKMLFYLLKNVDINPYITGAVQPKLSKFNLFLIEFLLPPLSEQKAMASVLSSLDDRIDLLHRQNKTLEQMAETLFRQWFIEEAKEDWEEYKIGEKLKVLLGGTPSTKKPEYWNGDIPWINSGEINKFRILEPTKYITQLGVDNSSTKLLPKGTTVLAITGATLGQVSRLQ